MKFSVIVFSAIILMFAAGCKEHTTSPNPPVDSTILKHFITGTVYLYDGNGNPVSNDGVTVTLKGTSASAVTDGSGKWKITGLVNGTYDLNFTKPAFGAVKIFGLKTIGADTVDEVEMDRSSTEIINFQKFTMEKSSVSNEPIYHVTAEFQEPEFWTDSVALVLCISNDSSALVKDPASAAVIVPFSALSSGYDGSFYWNSTNSFSLTSYPFSSGTKIYSVLCISGIGKSKFSYDGVNSSNYFDPVLGRQVFTALSGFAQVLTGVIP
jgi:hypothetical protein